MASDVQRSHDVPKRVGGDANKARANPGPILTNNLARNPRYSYLETPAEMQRPTFQQFSSPTNSTIDESPISPRRAYTDSLYGATPAATVPPEMPPVERTISPYGLPPQQEVHPAYYAPVDPVPAQSMQQSAPAADPLPVKNRQDLKTDTQDSRQDHTHDQVEEDPPKKLAQKDRVATIYNPDSLAGPNGAPLDNHRPGQVTHPNAIIDPEWKHGLCTPDALCCLGMLCPCIVYGKTQYRLSKKVQKQDPTDLLGYESCNGSCGLFALACGFQWALATIQRKRVRGSYHLSGDIGSDCLKSFCCCCCVVAQNEREVRGREDAIRSNAGLASAAYISPGPMTFAPPPR